MLLQHNKLIFFVLFLSLVFAQEKEIKKIVADYTEFDRRNNVVRFFGNVKIEHINGWITCDKAVYDEKNGKLNCATNVFFVYTSTTEYIEVRSVILEYDINQKLLNFVKNVSAVYNALKKEQDVLFDKISLTSENFVINLDTKNIIAKDNVIVDFQGNKIFCCVAKYDYKENIFKINDEVEKNQLRFEFVKEEWKIKYCQANTAVVNINENKILLKGKVEMVF